MATKLIDANLDLGGVGRITGLVAGTAPSDAVNKAQLDAAGGGGGGGTVVLDGNGLATTPSEFILDGNG